MLSNKPQWVNEETWYYEDKDGIDIVHECNVLGTFKVVRIKIPWRFLEKSLLRKKQSVKKKKTKVQYNK